MTEVSELLQRARKYDRRSVETLLGIHYPMVHRMAYGLTGREDVGRGVVRFVFHQSLTVLGKWDRDGTPQRWFSHHTVLTTRRAERYQPDTREDVLVKNATSAAPDYIAFVKALRSLPQQQREAFILTVGEGMDLRRVAVAMDCSTEAAGNHLSAANQMLRSISAGQFDHFTAEMRSAYGKLAPTEAVAAPSIKKFARKLLWPRRIKRLLLLVLLIAFAGAAWWLARKFHLI